MAEISAPLHGCRILVTRPEAQGEKLCGLIEVNGGKALHIPTMVIDAKPLSTTACQLITTLSECDFAIFTSANAVHCINTMLQQHWPRSASTALCTIAIGNGTAHALQQISVPTDLLPAHFSSEGILALAPLQQLAGRKIILFCGENGRHYLADTLRQRGANVEEIIAYRRRIAYDNAARLSHALQHRPADFIICTSNASLMNLFAILQRTGETIAMNTPLVAISRRLIPLARKLGFNHPPLVSSNATDNAIVAALIRRQEEKNDPQKRCPY